MQRSISVPASNRRIRPLAAQRWIDPALAAALGVGSLLLYGMTAAPSVAVLFDDTLEFQVVVPTLGIAHPSGYPLYTLLGKLFTLLLPWRDPAGRLNLFSALAAAAAVGLYYLAARHWARQRSAALIVALAFAISPVWWSQATLAEVYALHGLFVAAFLYLLVRWEEARLARRTKADRFLVALGLVTGLGLAHHRMLALLVPAALVMIVWTDPGFIRQPKRWLWPIVALATPLLLYVYLPLRGRSVTSLDGTYIPSLQATVDWIMARGYGVFLTGNPFNVHRDASFYMQLFQAQFGMLFLLIAFFGVLTAWRFGWRRYVTLLIATLLQVAFGLLYRTQDVEVFFLPAFMLVGLWTAWGLVILLDQATAFLAANARSMRLPAGSRSWLFGALDLLVAVIMLWTPVQNAAHDLARQDRSRQWGVYDYGQDMLANVTQGGRIIGLGGEVTLLRYFRDVLGQRPDLQVVRADAEADRERAVEEAMQDGVTPYLTRDLPGAAAKFSLSSAGPLVRAAAKAKPGEAPSGQLVGEGIELVRAQSDVRSTHAGPMLRLNLIWAATRPVTESLKVSARLLNAAGEQVAAQDRIPVNFTYPTTAWVPGEQVEDVYDLTSPAAPGVYKPVIILYRAADGREVGRVELDGVTF